MSNKYLAEEDYQASGLLYKIPLGIGKALQDAIIPEKVQQERLARQNEVKLQGDSIIRNLNDNLIVDMRADGLLGENYKPLETDDLSFGENLLSVGKEGNQFTPKYNEYIEALFGDFPLLTKTLTVGGTVEDFKPNRVIYNQIDNTVFLVGENYKGETAPKTLMASDADDDEIAQYSMSDFNELAKLALNTKYINSNQKPGYLSNAREDANAMADDVYEEIAMGIKEANEQGLIDDPEVLNQFNEGIISLIAEQQDEEKSKQIDDRIPPVALTEIRPEIAELLPDQAGPPEPGSKQAEAMAAIPMLEGSEVSEEDRNGLVDAWNNMNTAEKVSLLSTGLLVIPGVGAVGYTAVRGIALTAGMLSRAKIGTKLLDWSRKAVTRPKKEPKAVAKSGKKYDVDSPQGKNIVKAGEDDLKKRTVSEKLVDFGKGKGTGQNPRVVKDPVLDDAGKVVREFSPGRAGTVGAVGTAVGGNVAAGMIQGELDEMEDADMKEATPASEEIGTIDIPTFKNVQEAVDFFQNEDNYNKFIQVATSRGAQNVAQKLEDAFETLGVTDAQSFTTNLEEIKKRVNPQGDLNVNQTLAALIAERSGAPKETQATLFANTLNALTTSDRLGFDIAKERRSIATSLQTANLEDFETAYLGEIDTSGFIKEISDLFNADSSSFDDLENKMLLQRQRFAGGKGSILFPQYIMTPSGPRNVARERLLKNPALQQLNATQRAVLENNLNKAEALERAQTNQVVKALVNKYSNTNIFESIRNLFAGRGPFANPEDEIFSYIQVEVNQKEDGSYDPVRFIVRQPDSGARSSAVIEDQEFIREFGTLDSTYQMSFYANLPKRNIKVINKNKGSGTGP